MRFVCESCQTRYVIADDRLRGRILKVRCKKCGNLILLKAGSELRGGEGDTALSAVVPSAALEDSQPSERSQSDELTQMVDASNLRRPVEEVYGPPAVAPSGGDEAAEWHVILPKGQLGPLPLSALIQKMVGGEMPPRSFVWRDGMAGWKRASEVPEVARWLPAVRPGSSATSTGPHAIARAPEPEAASGAAPHDAAAERFFGGAGTDAGSGPIRPLTPDRLARVASSPEFAAAKPGELTKFFITQAHVSQGRSPWAVVAFGLGVAVLLVGGVIGLAQLGVPVPLVASGPAHAPKVFTGAQGDSRMRDLLLGRPKSPGAAQGGSTVHRAGTPGQIDPGGGPNQGPLATRAEQHVDQLGKSDKDQLSRLYATQDLSTLKLKQTGSALPILDRPDAPLTADQVSRTVAKFQTGYTRCIDSELKRNPNFQGGKIRIVTTIMSSGLVRQAQIVSDDQRLQRSVASGPLGGCLSEQTRRMVFPSFQGEPFDAEIPLVLSSAL